MKWLFRLIDSDLSASQEAELTLHLDNCESCQARLIELESVGLRAELRQSVSDDSKIDLGAFESTLAELRSDRPNKSQKFNGYADVMPWFGENKLHIGTLGEFELTRFIGRGGMGLVFEAIDTKLQRTVAVKIMSPGLLADTTASARFLREARSAAKVNHMNVVTVHSVDQIRGLPYLAMEFIQGRSIEDELDRNKEFPLSHVLKIARQTALGLAAAHSQGVIHRDIKPSNLMLDSNSKRIKIADFGLASTLNDVSFTRSGMMVGTPDFTSPEQAMAGTVDARSDLFSLGSVLYLLCTGRRPFAANSFMQTLDAVRNTEPERIDRLNAQIPSAVADIVQKLLEKQPEDRFQSADELCEAVTRFSKSQASHDRPGTGNGRTMQNKVLRTMSALFVTLVLMATVAGVYWLAQREAPEVTNVSEHDISTGRVEYPVNSDADPAQDSLLERGESSRSKYQVGSVSEFVDALKTQGDLELFLKPGTTFRLTSPISIRDRVVLLESDPKNRPSLELVAFDSNPSVSIENGALFLSGIFLKDTAMEEDDEAPIFCERGRFEVVETILKCPARSSLFVGLDSGVSLSSSVVVGNETAFSLQSGSTQTIEMRETAIVAKTNYMIEGTSKIELNVKNCYLVGQELFTLGLDPSIEHFFVEMLTEQTRYFSKTSLFKLSRVSQTPSGIALNTIRRGFHIAGHGCTLPDRLLAHAEAHNEIIGWKSTERIPGSLYPTDSKRTAIDDILNRFLMDDVTSLEGAKRMIGKLE